MIYLALAVAICVAIWEAFQLVKTRRELRATKDKLANVSDRLAQVNNEAELFSTNYSSETIEDFRLIAAAIRNGAEIVPLDAEQIGGTD